MATDPQLARWRAEGLLPRVEQIQIPYHGSTIEFPSGTAKQAVEIQRLLKIKNSFEYVGWELWWRGYPVDEKHWKPTLKKSAVIGDRLLRILRVILWKDDKITADHSNSVFDQKFDRFGINGMFSRMTRRIKDDQIGQFLRILTYVGAGRFQYFEDPAEPDKSDEKLLTSAFDLLDADVFNFEPSPDDPLAGYHRISEQRLNLSTRLVRVLTGYSQSVAQNKLIDVLNFSLPEIETARDDVRNALNIVQDYYSATKWIFGERSFGLRLINWIAQHLTPSQQATYILGFALMRRTGGILLFSRNIALLAEAAHQMRSDSMKLRKIAETDPKLRKLLSPKSLEIFLSEKRGEQLLLREIANYRPTKN